MIKYHGQANASSRMGSYGAEKAFWARGQYASTIKWISDGTFPHKVWFRFEHRVVLAKIGFSAIGPGMNPVKFDVIGADECEGTNATFSGVFLSVENAGFVGRSEAKSWIIPETNRQMHFCWGLEFFLSQSGRGARRGNRGPKRVGVRKILMWE